ncbi:Spo0E family sporulation regulatory protein-aspartic acid phosphatase [Virgibacillus halodenitrificans]|uniref:aspartyl-phosphate phosphatase Spo0E family protein n=1 Tax=Virgibacillus halodenitrificans TaxID=1482 RepID=UPI0002D6FAF5|nr:aspartyl-phosphate phosphatase Spo0E family protein [Virgibacillus halodenitrificans]MCJ0930684.1 aspartyl-phosphate phosphatase Spo0E family protein [Virgibacillus halodenitrificans]MYL45620.1 Spo0E family sporulation regulatory protein-aspartic acid phosphatase [Virgibacillus halodenitrificans]MYL57809.1 Spo0E family sporulation regulatory protein-aspartic acid phosphatase [Virgibacillus halodenitrificans]
MEGVEDLNTLHDLYKKIEETRQKMYQAYKNDPQSPEVLAISQTLDDLLNKLERLKREKTQDGN